MPSPNGSLVIVIKPKTKCGLLAPAMLFYIFQKELDKSYIFLKTLLSYIISVL